MSLNTALKYTFAILLSLPLTLLAQSEVRPRIIDGVRVSETNWPSVGKVEQFSSFCTGSLISNRCVLTAAHCVTNSSGNPLPTSSIKFFHQGTRYDVDLIFVHPTYKGFSDLEEDQFDVALMFLKEEVPGAQPSPLYRKVPQVGQKLTLVGFGLEGTGTTGSNNITPPNGMVNQGQTPIDAVSNTFIKWNFESNLLEKESNTAPGDSGGPSFILEDNIQYIAGTTSGGIKANASFGDLSYNVRVDRVAPWIDLFIPTTSGNHPPVFVSGPFATPNIQAINQGISFFTSVFDPNGDEVTVTWDFGDGNSTTGTGVSHAYAVSGVMNVAVTADDGNGGVTTENLTVNIVDNALLLSQVKIALKFPLSVKDKLNVKASFVSVESMTLANQSIFFSFANVERMLMLDEKENAPKSGPKIRFKVKKHKKGESISAGSEIKVSISLADRLSDEVSLAGINKLNANTFARSGDQASLTGLIVIASQLYGTSGLGRYRAKLNRSGNFKLDR